MSCSTSRHQLLKDTEAAEYLRLSPSTLRQHRCYNRGPAYVKLGSRVFYRAADLEAYRNNFV